MVLDCHWHPRGDESPSDIARALDRAGIERAIFFAPYFAGGDLLPGMPMADANRWMAKMGRELPDRVIPFAWIEPTLPGAVEEVERCVIDLGLRGVKMIPNHWYPTDEAVFPVYARIEELGVPIIFHSGILYGYRDCSRFCRPVYYEALINFPGIRFALAHISWPWVDECLAVYGRFEDEYHVNPDKRPQVKEIQMWIDITPGTPPAWREDALRKAVAFAGEDRLIWGSDTIPRSWESGARILERDRHLLTHQLGLPPASQEKILGGNLERFLQPRA